MRNFWNFFEKLALRDQHVVKPIGPKKTHCSNKRFTFLERYRWKHLEAKWQSSSCHVRFGDHKNVLNLSSAILDISAKRYWWSSPVKWFQKSNLGSGLFLGCCVIWYKKNITQKMLSKKFSIFKLDLKPF